MEKPDGKSLIGMNKKTGVVRRGIAWVVDILFLSIFFFPITYWYSGKWIMGPEEHLWGISDPICLIFLFIIFAYLILMEAVIMLNYLTDPILAPIRRVIPLFAGFDCSPVVAIIVLSLIPSLFRWLVLLFV
ncbi:YggT family protein [Chloroflexota bacterium]